MTMTAAARRRAVSGVADGQPNDPWLESYSTSSGAKSWYVGDRWAGSRVSIANQASSATALNIESDLLYSRIGSSPWVTWRGEGHEDFLTQEVPSLSVADQVRELQAALSVSKSALARILRVSRPTLYGWLGGGMPNSPNLARLDLLLRCIENASVSGTRPLNARFLKHSNAPHEPTLIARLEEPRIEEDTLTEAIRQTKVLGSAAKQSRIQREARLQRDGFQPVDPEQQRENLATTAALLDWPRG